MASSSSSSEKASSSKSSSSDNGFLEILSAQEALFVQTDNILSTLATKEPGADGMISLEPKTTRSLKDIFGNLKVRLLVAVFRTLSS